MDLGYVTLYVPDVIKTMDFYEKAFLLKVGFVAESKLYGEMLTGSTKLGFVDEEFIKKGGITFEKNRLSNQCAGSQISFLAEDVDAMHQFAIKNGALNLKSPEDKPWGQRVSYVRDINGCIVEICNPMA